MDMVNQALPVILRQVNLQCPESRPAAGLIVFGWELAFQSHIIAPGRFMSSCLTAVLRAG